MRHRVKKNKFKQGKDANKMILRKLVNNFIKHGHLTTTKKKVKALQSQIDRLVVQAKKKKNREIEKKINSKKLVNFLIEKVVPVFADRNSGFTTFKRIKFRLSDGSEMVKLTWAKPVVINKKQSDIDETKANKTDKS